MHNKHKIRNAGIVFFSTYGLFRSYTKFISPRWPKLNRHLYVLGRRVHHYETGLYLAALGLALFLEDVNDWIEQDERL